MVVKQLPLVISWSVSLGLTSCSLTLSSPESPLPPTPTTSRPPVSIPALNLPDRLPAQALTPPTASTPTPPSLNLPDLKTSVLSTRLNPDTLPPLPPIETVKLPFVAPTTQGVMTTRQLAEPQSSFTPTVNEVEISGMMQLGNSWSALVRVPNESDYRYVVEGEFLAGGEVMVKQIGLDANRQPLVILEENGLEVTKVVNLEPRPQTLN